MNDRMMCSPTLIRIEVKTKKRITNCQSKWINGREPRGPSGYDTYHCTQGVNEGTHDELGLLVK